MHSLGLRFRVNTRPIPSLRRTADLVFGPTRVAVFLDGCFWHGCPEHYSSPARNEEFWAEKVSRNRERDAETNRVLTGAGWIVLRFWEHDDPQVAASDVAKAVEARRASIRPGQASAKRR